MELTNWKADIIVRILNIWTNFTIYYFHLLQSINQFARKSSAWSVSIIKTQLNKYYQSQNLFQVVI